MATRTRRVAWSGVSRWRTWSYLSAGPGAWTNNLKIDLSLLESVTSGGPVPSYRRKIREVRSATTDLVAERYIWRGAHDGRFQVRRNQRVGSILTWIQYQGEGTLGLVSKTFADPSSLLISSVKNQVIQNIVRQIISAQTSLRGLVSAGEMAQTVRMINERSRGLNRGFHRYFAALVKGSKRPTSLRNMRQFVGNTWLEFQFGWKPLISDIHDGANALSKIITQKIAVQNVGYSSEGSEVTNSVVFHNPVNGPFTVHRSIVERQTYGCKIYGAVKNTVSIDGVSTEPLREFGITFNEFIPTLWELIPYSFLVDYFTNIGGIIDGCSLNRSNVAWLNLGERRAFDLESTPSITKQACPAGQYETDFVMIPGSPFYSSRVRLSRTNYSTGSLIQSLEFKIPGTSTKWLNIAALAITHRRTSALLRSRSKN